MMLRRPNLIHQQRMNLMMLRRLLYLLSASGIDSGSKTNLIVLIVSMGVLALGIWIDNEWVDYREE